MSNTMPEQVGRTALPVMSILGATLVVLKALGMITLSWLWVLAPFWLPLAMGIALVAAVAIVTMGAFLLALVSESSRGK